VHPQVAQVSLNWVVLHLCVCGVMGGREGGRGQIKTHIDI
jgi:hypothetical protein